MIKKIITILLLVIGNFTQSQTYTTIEPMENRGGVEQGVYYKDFNNVLNGYEGTYEYNGSDFYFKLILDKKVCANYNNYWWIDLLKGTYQYIINGVETNYLNDSLTTNNIPARVEIKIIEPSNDPALPYVCSDCLAVKWLRGYISDRVNKKAASIAIAKKIVNGQEGIHIMFHLEVSSKQPWESNAPIQLPIKSFFMKKL